LLLAARSRTDPLAAGTSQPATDLEVATGPATVAETSIGETRSAYEPHRAFIETAVANGRNAVAICQDLVEHHGYDGAYNAVKRFVRKPRPRDPKVSCRFETAPGQEAQVDYREGALTRDPRTGTYRRPRLFVMTLGASRHAYRATVWTSSTKTWCDLHAYLRTAPICDGVSA
jgi:transposase